MTARILAAPFIVIALAGTALAGSVQLKSSSSGYFGGGDNIATVRISGPRKLTAKVVDRAARAGSELHINVSSSRAWFSGTRTITAIGARAEKILPEIVTAIDATNAASAKKR